MERRMKKKIYVHYEGKYSSQEITLISHVEEETTLTNLFQQLRVSLSLSPSEGKFALELSSGEILEEKQNQTEREREKERIFERVENKEDCLIHDVIITPAPVSSPRPTIAQAPPMAATPNPTSQRTNEVIDLKEIEKMISKQEYRKARVKCEEILKRAPQKFSALELLCQILYLSKAYLDAISAGEKALLFETPSTSCRIYLHLGQSYLENEDYEEAFSTLRRGAELLEGKHLNEVEKNLMLDLKAELCRSLFLLGKHQEAGGIINDLMTTPPSPRSGDPQSNVNALMIYAEIAAQYNKVPEALQATLKAAVIDQNNSRVKRLLASLLSHPTGLDEFYSQIRPTASSASAFAFVAIAIKDHSALTAAEQLFRKIISMHRAASPGIKNSNSNDIHNHVLNLIHILETSNQPLAALEEVRDHLRSIIACGIELPLEDILDEIDSALRTRALNIKSPTLFFPPILETGIPPVRILWESKSEEKDGSATIVPVDFVDSSSITSVLEPCFDVCPPLDLLAVLFTTIKILFVQGNIGLVTRLIEKVDRLRRTYQKLQQTLLHATSVRNEHAYYLCICQYLEVVQNIPSLPTFPYYNRSADSASRPIFVVGDSHCLSTAWAEIAVPDFFGTSSENHPRLLVPKLVTGVKQWHLRSESDFYPKFGFQKAISSLPDGSDVILVIGEIDCREGLLIAVERGVYPSIEAGMQNTLRVMQSTITTLIAKKKFRIFIHPVNPVLDITRQIVIRFNQLYREAVSSIPGCYWLDFFEQLLTLSADGSPQLGEPWRMDGTHLHPQYVALIEGALRNVGRK